MPLSSLVPPVLQEAVSTGDPEMVQLVLQYRDYQRATQRLAGIPELLNKLRQVQQGTEVWPVRGVEAMAGGHDRLCGGHRGHPCQACPWKGTQPVQHAFLTLSVRSLSYDSSPGSRRQEGSEGPQGSEWALWEESLCRHRGAPSARNLNRALDHESPGERRHSGMLDFLEGGFHLTPEMWPGSLEYLFTLLKARGGEAAGREHYILPPTPGAGPEGALVPPLQMRTLGP